MERKSGVLLAVSSLPGPFGIGTMGKQAFAFIDSLKKSGQRLWQILPLSPTGFGNSPYQSVSAFAGNPDLIDPELLCEDGLLTKEEIETYKKRFDPKIARTQYDLLGEGKREILYPAFLRAGAQMKREICDFAWENSTWIHDYALYIALSRALGTGELAAWPEKLRLRDGAALIQAACENRTEIDYQIFCQYIFFRQWDRLKAYANKNGVSIIGDMPIYVSSDSADRWANRGLFDPEGRVAGCPPDAFAPEGQLWGNPIYNWDAMKKDGYRWWLGRIGFQLAHYDLVRIDHFRGFEAYWAIPGTAKSAAEGQWIEGPADDFMDKVVRRFGRERFIAEDLGSLTDSFFAFMDRCGMPGLKVLEFAFTPGADSIYLPHRHVKNAVVYTGTHDNDTALGWYRAASEEERAFARAYLGTLSERTAAQNLVRAAFASVCDLCVVPMQDILGLGSDARMNTPSTVGSHNWTWRMKEGQFDEKTEEKLLTLTKLYGRY